MHKWIAATAAVVLTGALGIFSTGGDAQDARGTDKAPRPDIERVEHAGVQPVQFVRGQQQQRPGTWGIVTHDKVVLLYNTASGQTFHLNEREGNLHWKPVPGPGHERPRHENPNRRERPDRGAPSPRAPRDLDRMGKEDLENRLERMRERMREARGETRERLERAIHKIEEALEKRRKGDRENRPGRAVDDLEDVMGDIEERLRDLEEKLGETENRRERRELKGAIDELREEAGKLRKKIKDLHGRD